MIEDARGPVTILFPTPGRGRCLWWTEAGAEGALC